MNKGIVMFGSKWTHNLWIVKLDRVYYDNEYKVKL